MSTDDDRSDGPGEDSLLVGEFALGLLGLTGCGAGPAPAGAPETTAADVADEASVAVGDE